MVVTIYIVIFATDIKRCLNAATQWHVEPRIEPFDGLGVRFKTSSIGSLMDASSYQFVYMKRIEEKIDLNDLSDYIQSGLFRQELTDEGRLLRQELCLVLKDDKLGKWDDWMFSPPELDHSDQMLYHVAPLRMKKDIQKYGLLPKVGDIYNGHWRGYYNSGQIGKLLYPGIFLSVGKRVNGGRRKGYFTCKVPYELLDPDYVLIDHAFRNEESIFYMKPIPPEALFITR